MKTKKINTKTEKERDQYKQALIDVKDELRNDLPREEGTYTDNALKIIEKVLSGK